MNEIEKQALIVRLEKAEELEAKIRSLRKDICDLKLIVKSHNPVSITIKSANIARHIRIEASMGVRGVSVNGEVKCTLGAALYALQVRRDILVKKFEEL